MDATVERIKIGLRQVAYLRRPDDLSAKALVSCQPMTFPRWSIRVCPDIQCMREPEFLRKYNRQKERRRVRKRYRNRN